LLIKIWWAVEITESYRSEEQQSLILNFTGYVFLEGNLMCMMTNSYYHKENTSEVVKYGPDIGFVFESHKKGFD